MMNTVTYNKCIFVNLPLFFEPPFIMYSHFVYALYLQPAGLPCMKDCIMGFWRTSSIKAS